MKYKLKRSIALLAIGMAALACGVTPRVVPTPSPTQPIPLPSPVSNSFPDVVEELDFFPLATDIDTSPRTKISPTPAPSPTATATKPAATIAPALGVMQELGFFPGAGGADCPQDLLFDPNTSYPNTSGLHYSLFIASDESRVICLYGVPVGEEFNIVLVGLDGSILAGGRFIILLEDHLEAYWLDSPSGPILIGDGFPQVGLPDTVGIDLAWPLPMPDQGTIRVSSDSFSLETSFDNPQSSQPAWLSVLPPQAEETSLFVDNGCFQFSNGEQVDFNGGGFSPGSQVPVGVYLDKLGQSNAELSSSGTLAAGAGGLISGYISIEDGDPAGLYYIVAVLNPDATHAVWDNAGPIACFQVR